MTWIPSPSGTPVTDAVLAAAADQTLPAYIYDLRHLADHLARIRAAFDGVDAPIELLHAVKANPDPELLATIAEHVHGLEVASGGELAHVRAYLPAVSLAFGGPGKTEAELAAALAAGVDRYHVESRHELRQLDALARATGQQVQVLLRVNLSTGSSDGAALTMGGMPSPFGMDPAEADAAAADLVGLPGIQVLGVHAHLASGLDPAGCAVLADIVLSWAAEFGRRHHLDLREVNVGGGMAVDYRQPDHVFDWADYARRLAVVSGKHPSLTVRIEPGRAISAYSGWYATHVLDLKPSHGEWFAVCAGGTHHLRTPAAKGHDQPLVVVSTAQWHQSWPRPSVTGEPVTFVGQLCTPKDVLARQVRLPRIAIGDLVVFAMCGAYAYNISHHDFLMHPAPTIAHLR